MARPSSLRSELRRGAVNACAAGIERETEGERRKEGRGATVALTSARNYDHFSEGEREEAVAFVSRLARC